MSWPLAAFAIVFAVLFAGWLAYERSRPSARMVAVVGTLAAVAALGRDAFVALPDVKPITAMTLVVGYALGPLPGFTVGAVGMLASNIVLGQGPYTPWQMAAWGLVGLLGAALGRLAGRRLGRVALALACALSALVAKEIMNVYEWTVSASHTLPSLALTVSKGVPFDVTDVVASFLFGLAFGPELARLLARTRERMTVAWEPPARAAALLVVALVALPCGYARPRSAAAASPTAARVADFLERAQNPGGGFGSAPGERSSELYSAWAALGLAAAGRNPNLVERGGQSVLAAIRGEAPTLQGAGDLERTMLALHACGAAANLPGLGDLTAALERYRASDGSFEHLVNITAFALLALRADGRPSSDPVVREAAEWLRAQQEADGGFGYSGRGGIADVDDTGAVLQALVATGQAGATVRQRAVEYLLGAVNRDGGFPQQPGGESNAQSTAWAVQALVAAHRDPSRPLGGARRSPLAYLEGLVASDGSVRYSSAGSQTPVWVSAQALTALELAPLPIARPPAARALGSSASRDSGMPAPVTSASRSSRTSAAAADRHLPSGPRGSAGPSRSARHGGKQGALVGPANLLLGSVLGGSMRDGGLDRLARATGALIALALAPLEGQW